METKIIETSQSDGPDGGSRFSNWGKFMVARFTPEERAYASALPGGEGCQPLARWGGDPEVLWVLDLATGEGALFRPGGLPDYDLRQHAIHVCPMYPGFLAWLYQQDLSDLQALPAFVSLPDVEFSLIGRRWPGPDRE